MAANIRADWTALSESELLAQCEVDTYRASGPGGQKRNKTSSAVRIRHLPTGLIVIAEESRSQHENRARAFKRLREALYLKIRDPFRRDELAPQALAERSDFPPLTGDGRLKLGRKDERFWPTVGFLLDVLEAVEARVSDAAKLIGISTGNLISFLETEAKVWEQVNVLRAKFDQKPLKT